MAVTVLYRKWTDDIVSVASKLLLEEMPLPAGSPGGMEAFRCSLTSSFFFKFYLTVRLQLEQKWVSLLVDGCFLTLNFHCKIITTRNLKVMWKKAVLLECCVEIGMVYGEKYKTVTQQV